MSLDVDKARKGMVELGYDVESVEWHDMICRVQRDRQCTKADATAAVYAAAGVADARADAA